MLVQVHELSRRHIDKKGFKVHVIVEDKTQLTFRNDTEIQETESEGYWKTLKTQKSKFMKFALF